MKAKLNETDYLHHFMGAASLALPRLRLFRRNVGVIKLEGRVLRAGIKGQADLYGYERDTGRAVEIEVKLFGKLTPDQERWRDWCREWGVRWMLLAAQRDEAHGDTIARWVREVGEMMREGSSR